jgi:hypothetical protein
MSMKTKVSKIKKRLPSYEKYTVALLVVILILVVIDTFINPTEDSSVHRLMAVAIMLVAGAAFKR